MERKKRHLAVAGGKIQDSGFLNELKFVAHSS